jgi:hypothetical protein
MLVPYVESPLTSIYQESKSVFIGGNIAKTFIFRQRGEGTGGLLWPAAVLLSRFLSEPLLLSSLSWRGRERSDWIWSQKNVLEIGAGLGLVTTTLLHLGSNVTSSDGEPSVLFQLNDNLLLNCDSDMISHQTSLELLWGTGKVSDYRSEGYDSIIAADVVYGEQKDVWDSLISTLYEASRIRPDGLPPTLILIAQVFLLNKCLLLE